MSSTAHKLKRVRHCEISLDQVLPKLLDQVGKKRAYIRGYHVKINSLRLVTFKTKGTECVSCGIRGEFFALEGEEGKRPHLNLYARRGKREVLMTKDHILPVSRGGRDHLNNMQTMCSSCNARKGNTI